MVNALLQVPDRSEARSCKRADATVVVRVLRPVAFQVTIQLDNVGVL